MPEAISPSSMNPAQPVTPVPAQAETSTQTASPSETINSYTVTLTVSTPKPLMELLTGNAYKLPLTRPDGYVDCCATMPFAISDNESTGVHEISVSLAGPDQETASLLKDGTFQIKTSIS